MDSGRAILRGQCVAERLGAVCVTLLLCLMIVIVPLLLTKSHGPGAFAEAARAEISITMHGHSHDWDGAGQAGHNAADHDHGNLAFFSTDHRSFAMMPRKLNLRLSDLRADGIEGGGLRRPPRAAVL
ncbi:hypothetical protein [Tabrizicola sp.]|uniref:hypothetical protein n=1 Tax=Tabrizicola sp. TaxID=2005166 RepID=UPI0035B20278